MKYLGKITDNKDLVTKEYVDAYHLGQNLIETDKVSRGAWLNNNGVLVTTSLGCITTDFIPVKPGDIIHLHYWQPENTNSGDLRAWSGSPMYYKADKTYLSGYTSTYFTDEHYVFTETVPANCYFVRASYQFARPIPSHLTNANWTNSDYSAFKWKLEIGPEPTDWSAAPEDDTITLVKGNAETTYRRGQVNLTAANVGGVSKSGDTMTGQLKTSFKSSVAMGSFGASSSTIPDLCEELRYSSGCCGSFNNTSAYTRDGVTIPSRWYNFLWIPHRSGGVNGTASGDNCNYGVLYLTGMNGDLGRMWIINYSGSQIVKLAELTPLNNINGYLATHPERGTNTIIPFINNDIAFLRTLGGSYKVYYDGVEQSVNIDSLFDASATYWGSINVSNITEIVIELTLHKAFTYGNKIYVDSGNAGWRAQYTRIETAMNNAADEWLIRGTISDNQDSFYVVNANGSNVGIRYIRFTFKNFASANFSLAQLGLVQYSSQGLRLTSMSRGIDDPVYRSITPYATNTYDLGSSSKYWNNGYFTKINSVTVGSSPKFTDTTALGSMTGTLGVDHGGTGQTSAVNAANAFMNALTTGSSTPSDNDYYISQYVGGGTTTTTYHRRPVSALWEYIKGKISSILGLTATNYGGNSATATKATQDGSGNTITTYYAPKSTAVTNVAYDSTNKKLTKTINGTTSDVVTAATLKTAMSLTKSDVGLGNVDNTSDANKPISTATQTALNNKADLRALYESNSSTIYSTLESFADEQSQDYTYLEVLKYGARGVANGVAPLDGNGKVPTSYLPDSSGGDVVTGNARVFYGTCTIAAATQAKTVTCTSYDSLTDGDILVVKFQNANSHATPTLNVNSKGAKNIKQIKNGALSNLGNAASVRGTCTFVYDATNSAWILQGADDNTTYSAATTSANGLMSSGDKTKLDGIYNTLYPVGSIYVTSTNSAPTFNGTWTLVDKEFAPQKITSGIFTHNTTNVTSVSVQNCSLGGHTAEFYVNLTSKVAFGETNLTLGEFALANCGLSSIDGKHFNGVTDAGNAVCLAQLDNDGTLQHTDVVIRGTGTSMAASTAVRYYASVVVTDISTMDDDFCNKFYWKRTA